MPVIGIDDGSEIGKVRHAMIDADQERVVALAIENHRWWRPCRIVVLEDVVGVGDEVLVVAGLSRLLTMEDRPDLERIAMAEPRLLGRRVFMRSGAYAGEVAGYSFDRLTGKIAHLEVRPDSSADGRQLDFERVLVLGRDVVVVKDEDLRASIQDGSLVQPQGAESAASAAAPAADLIADAPEPFAQDPTPLLETAPALLPISLEPEYAISDLTLVEAQGRPAQVPQYELEMEPPPEPEHSEPEPDIDIDYGFASPEAQPKPPILLRTPPPAAVRSVAAVEALTPVHATMQAVAYPKAQLVLKPAVDASARATTQQLAGAMPDRVGSAKVVPAVMGTAATAQATAPVLAEFAPAAAPAPNAVPPPTAVKAPADAGATTTGADLARLFRERQERFLLGKAAQRAVKDDNGQILVAAGQTVDQTLLDRVKEASKLLELTASVSLRR